MSKHNFQFKLIEFNPRRAIRGVSAARVNATNDAGETDLLWMTESDVRRNMMAFGEHPELVKALACYKQPLVEYPPVNPVDVVISTWSAAAPFAGALLIDPATTASQLVDAYLRIDVDQAVQS